LGGEALLMAAMTIRMVGWDRSDDPPGNEVAPAAGREGGRGGLYNSRSSEIRISIDTSWVRNEIGGFQQVDQREGP
jgi:hypothetical protein